MQDLIVKLISLDSTNPAFEINQIGTIMNFLYLLSLNKSFANYSMNKTAEEWRKPLFKHPSLFQKYTTGN